MFDAMTDEETTELQFAVDAGDLDKVRSLLAPYSSQVISSLQFYGNSTALMYALQRGRPEIVEAFLDRGATAFELPWSDNNELKSAVRNPNFAPQMVQLVLKMLPDHLALEMITSDWNPEDHPDPDLESKSALQLAESLPDPTCQNLLRDALRRLQR